MTQSEFTLSKSYDVLVLGAGVAGLGVASAFAKRGFRVAVISPKNMKGTASPCAAGILDPFLEIAKDSPVLPVAVKAFYKFPRFLREIEKKTGRKTGYKKTGLLYVAMSPADQKKLKGWFRWQKKWMPSLVWMEKREILKRFPQTSRNALGGLYYPEVGKIHAPQFVQTYKLYVKALGVRFFETSRHFKLKRKHKEFQVVAAGQRISAKKVVNAAGAWSSKKNLLGSRIRVLPARGQILLLKNKKDLPVIFHSLSGGYLVPWGKGRHLAGSTVEFSGFRGNITTAGLKKIIEKVTLICPDVSKMKMTGGWAGLRPYSESKLPVIGPVPGQPDYYTATGYFRSGILLGSFLGEQLTDIVLSGRCPPMIRPFLIPPGKAKTVR